MINNATECIPTVLGILAIGKDPRSIVPSAYTQFLRIDGNDYSAPITDEEAIEGSLDTLIIRIDDKIKAHNRVKVDLSSSITEKRIYQYPLFSLQQLVRNAVMHRTYEHTNAPVRIYWFNNRIEIISPGGPFGIVTEENFGNPGLADYRNPRLADAMKVLGFVQRFGVGIQSARKALNKNGNPPLEFQVTPTIVCCILYTTFTETPDVNAPVRMLELNRLQHDILGMIEADCNITYEQLAITLQKHKTTIMRNIAKLKKMNLLIRQGSAKTGHWVISNYKDKTNK
jgi:predicted HTH transcriptional regulator